MFSFLLDLSNSLRFGMSSTQNIDAVGILKRRCEVLEEQLAAANTPKPKRYSSILHYAFKLNSFRISLVQGQIYAGRPIRRLVSFFDGARELVEENDRRLILELESMEAVSEGDREDHTIE
jgi:hypothetical protein